MKVKAFKLLPGIDFNGADIDALHIDANPAPADGGAAYNKRTDTNSEKFRKDFVLSVDGERLDPGHGVICEVHQGLAKFIADSKLQKYRPTSLLRPVVATPELREATDADTALRRWLNAKQQELQDQIDRRPLGYVREVVVGNAGVEGGAASEPN